jgi:hypothetical protein
MGGFREFCFHPFSLIWTFTNDSMNQHSMATENAPEGNGKCTSTPKQQQ